MTLNPRIIREYYLRKNFIFVEKNKKKITREQTKHINEIRENVIKKIDNRKVHYKNMY